MAHILWPGLEPEKPGQFFNPMNGLTDGTPLFVTDDMHPSGSEYVRSGMDVTRIWISLGTYEEDLGLTGGSQR